ncbi:MAG: SDR family oxidoreductase [Anaerolineae bacterium]|nr:SDR family oxidoreductase [Anaerolineae bacterium]
MTTFANPLDLSNKVMLITGGAQGIGEATARLCAERGARVVIGDFNPRGEEVAHSITEAGGSAAFVQTDVRDDAQVAAMVDKVRTLHGRLDILVCAAGVLKGPYMQPEELPIEEFVMTIDVNIKGVFLCARHAAPLLEQSGNGVMIVVASGAGVIGPSSSLAYGASKGGANGLGMTLANHLKGRNIRVNTLAPGNIVTDMKMSVEIAGAQREGRSVNDAIAKAQQEYGVPEGVARVIAFMVSPEADYLRGVVFTR